MIRNFLLASENSLAYPKFVGVTFVPLSKMPSNLQIRRVWINFRGKSIVAHPQYFGGGDPLILTAWEFSQDLGNSGIDLGIREFAQQTWEF